MRQTTTMTRQKIVRRIAPIALVAMLGVGAAACGTSGASPRTQNAPTQNAPAQNSQTPTTAAPSSGGAGF